jgi:glucose/mannose-6-phosphate isomerase
MLDDIKLIHQRDPAGALERAEKQWSTTEWSAVVPTAKNLAKQIALEVIGKTPILYAGPILTEVATSWKAGFNQQAKHLAWVGELTDTELTGWTKQPVHKPFVIIDLRSSLDNPETQRRFDAAEQLLSGLRPAPITVHSLGSAEAEQQSWCSALGDFVAVYTAILNGVDPSSTAFSDKFNKQLEQTA